MERNEIVMPTNLDAAVELYFTELVSAIGAYKATALHLSVGVPPSLRISGQIVTMTEEQLLTGDFLTQIVAALLTEEQQQYLAVRKSLLTTITIKNKTRCKLHVYYQQGQLSLTLSLIPNVVAPIEHLAVPQSLKALTQLRSGLVIVAGEYGQGKSTVLAGFIESLNQTVAQHIVTFEQSIEHTFNDAKSVIEQLEIGRDIPDVAAIVPFVSQEDVDTILISTVLDAVTVKTALHLAQMGKLVWLEVTAPTAHLALSECMSMFLSSEQEVIRDLLVTNLAAVVALRLATSNTGATTLTTEIAKKSAALTQLLRADNLDKLALVIENGHNDGMITFAQATKELQNF